MLGEILSEDCNRIAAYRITLVPFAIAATHPPGCLSRVAHQQNARLATPLPHNRLI
jgi:hypothetical protein